MKRFLSLLLALSLFCLCGCGAAAPATESAAPAEETAAAADEAPAVEAPELAPILAEIRERMHPATAGSSLTAAQLASMLLDWCAATPMEEAQIRGAMEDFLSPMSDRERIEFAEQLSAVRSAADLLRGEDGEALMDDIGGTGGTLWPWADAPMEKLDTLFSAVVKTDLRS